ncbi:MAG: transglycosylase SLT domain-containing protein [Pseudolabrys sp.]|nr:transglycosylase SLT domain-containing protein [Pseudolabrys sp.]MDP2296737.1 transglycosylase SLT domain-containing protein [Pseudolabrys sp.]
MVVDSVSTNRASQITGAIRQASQSTGISFQYLLTTAKIESGLNPSAQATTSSAKGLYQFIDQTWLGTMKQEGASLGLGHYANAITRNSDGRYEVADPASRAAIMKLRSDPETSALMAGAFSRANAFQLIGSVGRPPTEGELYIAHFLGPDGAGRLINAADSRPDANAAKMFPAAAAANHNIFYDKSGSARSIGEVYSRLTGKFDNARTVAVAAAMPRSDNVAAPAASSAAGMTAIPVAANAVRTPVAAPDTAGITQALADARSRMQSVTDSRPLFQAMFSDRGDDPITQTVANLWTPSAADQTGAKPGAARSGRGLDLFSDGATNARGIFHGKV